MSQVYVITTGAYSGYHIVGVFSTKEKADEYLAWRNKFVPKEDWDNPYDAVQIEEWGLDKIFPSNPNLHPFLVFFGDTADMRVETDYDYTEEEFTEIKTYPNGNHALNVWAKDEEHAAKIATERRSLWLIDQQPRV